VQERNIEGVLSVIRSMRVATPVLSFTFLMLVTSHLSTFARQTWLRIIAELKVIYGNGQICPKCHQRRVLPFGPKGLASKSLTRPVCMDRKNSFDLLSGL
jgi:hypothetical protein